MKKSMTIARALKEKKRIINKIYEIHNMISRYNSVDLGTRRPAFVKDYVARLAVLEENLMRLKAALHGANLDIARKLMEVKLLNDRIDFYLRLETAEQYTVRDSDNQLKTMTRDVVVKEEDVLAKVEELKGKRESVQDEIDEYNATRSVEVDLLGDK